MISACPFAGHNDTRQGQRQQTDEEQTNEEQHTPHEHAEEGVQAPKCPLGYDAGSFKLGPLSCIICRALLFNSSRCLPCRHIYCRSCILRFQDCPLCGLDIENIEPDPDLQAMVDNFIEGHARIKRPKLHGNGEVEHAQGQENVNVAYEDVSLARGSFLLQHAMRAFQAQNLESARARLDLCVEDTREELTRRGVTTEISSQLGAVLGMLGDCLRAMGDVDGAMTKYEESVQILSRIQDNDVEVIHALSVSLNKLGDLKYYAEQFSSARDLYKRALDIRKNAIKDYQVLSPQILDVAISLTKVADVDRSMGKEALAIEGFQEALKTLEGLSLQYNMDTLSLEKRRSSILEFLCAQLKDGHAK
ncbi:hypothetical protein O6H91_01G024200 [Diphasiastrum complanatum]|uniref:Uncharacterized protein n=2 Tax=Diphasiastrum complanatum TaxID=34168 RepID=A0ACC2EP56_DIPCM|nr:hypothetical protein O6H91_01G024200 [Diphasiastrum complanatum]KAJ7568229.1 hypothetical protein O6H91_01G024200 [Diphasiastrum complanatum]